MARMSKSELANGYVIFHPLICIVFSELHLKHMAVCPAL